ncbi:helix-turn-helix transcriptional regulator [Sporosarcina saromensis]|uniref:Helix-turn-helix transcriptional regulator n=1 Tax=Sporosarcina saromensis TaxID=359365 RepID=A0ABU4G3P5_9BACL|nr:helix-turn-helix transcriptional regulator [Sporosarcina saromensis]MDW0111584.1 helix-turn-helix transcriptional regulator [Sporosarcina saromensis]
MNYGDRLKTLRNNKGLSQKDLTDRLHINRSTYARYETNSTQPDYETLSRLADFFDVTIDYLLARSDIPNHKAVFVAGKDINLTDEELVLFNELKKHQIMFHHLMSNPKKKVKELNKLYKMKQMFMEDEE